jgi:hypothetical protein
MQHDRQQHDQTRDREQPHGARESGEDREQHEQQ